MSTSARIQLRRDTAANWTSANPVLASGEPGLETDTGKEKRGDGTTAWTSLAYITDTTRLPQAVGSASSVPASGDASGATDVANLMAALNAYGRAKGVPGQTYTLNSPVLLPSHSTLDMRGCIINVPAGTYGTWL